MQKLNMMNSKLHAGRATQQLAVRRRGGYQHSRARQGTPPRAATPPERPEGSGSEAGPSTSTPSSSASGPGPSLIDPVQTIYWGGTLPNTRRAALGLLSGTAIALGGNLGGITSWLLGLDGGRLAGQLRADVLVPVRGAKRCVDYTFGFEFTYPTAWLGDQTLAYRAAKRAEAARGGLRGGPVGFGAQDDDEEENVNFPPLSGPSASASRAGSRPAVAVAEPVAAFGPPGTTGEENVSVIVAPIAPGFTLASLGDPRDAADRFLTTLAPDGSGLKATLLTATQRTTTLTAPGAGPTGQGQQEEQLYYTLEYTVRGPRFYRHNVSVYTARKDLLYTFNAQCPEARWEEDAAALLASAASFKLL